MFKENLSAFENMKVNLLANRLVPEKVPLVIQYNKQDLPDLLSETELSRALNPWGRKAFPAVALQGRGVMETFVAVVQDMLAAIAVKYNLKEKGLDPAAVPEVVAEAFASVLKQAGTSPPAAVQPPPPAAAVPPPSPASAGAPIAVSSRPAVAPAIVPQAPQPSSQQPAHARVVVSQPATSAPGSSLHAAPEAGLVSEALLHRSIKSNVELAEALATLVREMNLGLNAILTHAERLSLYGNSAPDKSSAAVTSIRQEGMRLRRFLQELGGAGAPSVGPAPAARPAAAARPGTPMIGTPVGPSPSVAAAPAAVAARSAPAAAGPGVPAAGPAGNASFDALLRETVGGVRGALDARSLSVQIQVPPGTALPRCPPNGLRGALAGLLEGAMAAAPPQSALSLRCERKPVLLRTRDGEVKRDFLMVALSPGAALTIEEQQKVVQGSGAGPVGQAARSIREMGGFVRFAPSLGAGSRPGSSFRRPERPGAAPALSTQGIVGRGGDHRKMKG